MMRTATGEGGGWNGGGKKENGASVGGGCIEMDVHFTVPYQK
jgi:hypothetical protein